jgi:hypothetical protein
MRLSRAVDCVPGTLLFAKALPADVASDTG